MNACIAISLSSQDVCRDRKYVEVKHLLAGPHQGAVRGVEGLLQLPLGKLLSQACEWIVYILGRVISPFTFKLINNIWYYLLTEFKLIDLQMCNWCCV